MKLRIMGSTGYCRPPQRGEARGWLAQLHLADGKAVIYSRNGVDLCRFRSSAAAVEVLPASPLSSMPNSSLAMLPGSRASAS